MRFSKMPNRFRSCVIIGVVVAVLTSCVLGCSKPNITNNGVLIVQCIDRNGNPIANTEITVAGLTNREIAFLFTTDRDGRFTITSRIENSRVTFMIVTPEITYKQEEDVSAKMRNNGGSLVVTFDFPSKDDEAPKYVSLEKLKESISDVNDFGLVGHWCYYNMIALPLYPITERYPTGDVSVGEGIPTVSIYILGEYANNSGDEITVALLQDKTFENGGFIYIDNKDKDAHKRTYYYKYKNCYIILSSSLDVDMVTVYDFLGALATIIGENYEETSMPIYNRGILPVP